MIEAQIRSTQVNVRRSSSPTESPNGHSIRLLHPANDLDDPSSLSTMPTTNSTNSYTRHTSLCTSSQSDTPMENPARNLASVSRRNTDTDEKKSSSSLIAKLICMIEHKINDITRLEASALAECLECLIDDDTVIEGRSEQAVTITRNREFSRGESWFHLQWQESNNRRMFCEIRFQPGSKKCTVDSVVEELNDAVEGS